MPSTVVTTPTPDLAEPLIGDLVFYYEYAVNGHGDTMSDRPPVRCLAYVAELNPPYERAGRGPTVDLVLLRHGGGYARIVARSDDPKHHHYCLLPRRVAEVVAAGKP
jgi:hypothetical protein